MKEDSALSYDAQSPLQMRVTPLEKIEKKMEKGYETENPAGRETL